MEMKKIVMGLILMVAGGLIYFGLQRDGGQDDVIIQTVHGSNQAEQSNTSVPGQSLHAPEQQKLRQKLAVAIHQRQKSSSTRSATNGQGLIRLTDSATKQGLTTATVKMYNSAHQLIGQATIITAAPTCSIVSGTESLSVEDGKTHTILIPEQHVDQYLSYSINYTYGTWYLTV